MFGFGKKQAHHEIGAQELHSLIEAGSVQVVDVREPGEFAAGHIPGAVNMPLSDFQPSTLPHDGRRLILNCLGGKRSAMALDKCAAAERVIDTHLAGGFGAWQQAGLPVER
ncbi:rhodanese-like domain-containing protein [Qipengyuania sp. YIM B01966]|uniref:rhodanese-like domain-containing protein n=1 Tax=Qipengyuania sp. YIM B01966 TaxID=2778646 RepID=UPI000DB0A30C|nr:rhodanese-like domain-containing protein [Qipengyuania sp. YIM B01966]PZU17366.1 MAG: sulfurtransferase [Citromicrobium sp.]